MVQNTGFISGMIDGRAKSEQAARSGSKGKVFDWDEAARIIKARKPEADLLWLFLMIDGEEIPCFTSGDDPRGYNSGTKWPQSALDILNEGDNIGA